MNERLPIRDRTLVLRILVPGLEARLKDKMKEMEERGAFEVQQQRQQQQQQQRQAPHRTTSNSDTTLKELYLDLEGVTCEPTAARNSTLWNFHCDGATYPAKLVNLPCPIEVHKTHDHAAYYKCSDVAQMLIVFEDEMALLEQLQEEEKQQQQQAAANLGGGGEGGSTTLSSTSNTKMEQGSNYYPSGLTPPMRRVVERRFEAREHKSIPPPQSAVMDGEAALVELMEKLAKDGDKATSASKRKNKIPVLTSTHKVLEEVEEEVVPFEPWMAVDAERLIGVEFDAYDEIAKQHPEIWLSGEEISDLREKAKEEQEAAAKAHAEAELQQQEKERKKLEKKQKKKKKQKQQDDTGPTVKKGIASKKNREAAAAAVAAVAGGNGDPMDEVTQAATTMMTGTEDDIDLDDDALDFDFSDIPDDLNLDGVNL